MTLHVHKLTHLYVPATIKETLPPKILKQRGRCDEKEEKPQPLSFHHENGRDKSPKASPGVRTLSAKMLQFNFLGH